jgi:hypothetical protein
VLPWQDRDRDGFEGHPGPKLHAEMAEPVDAQDGDQIVGTRGCAAADCRW